MKCDHSRCKEDAKTVLAIKYAADEDAPNGIEYLCDVHLQIGLEICGDRGWDSQRRSLQEA